MENWQRSLQEAKLTVSELLAQLQLRSESMNALHHMQDFPLRVTQSYVRRIEASNPNDPLLRQILPVADELLAIPGYTHDPLQEKQANPVPGVLHKYHGRVLLTVTGACAIHCRYCFRRSFPYQENNPGKKGWERVFEYIQNDPSIREVILSGGDPLSVPDEHLAFLLGSLKQLPHLKRIRIHSRMPIVLPERITPSLLSILENLTLPVVMVIHCNHAQEINDEVQAVLINLHRACHSVLNQAVLLRGVNDTVDALVSLSNALFETQVQPYYLHLLDPVKGAHHFDVSQDKAIALMSDISKQLPGYLVPKLVKEVPGAAGKNVIGYHDNASKMMRELA